MKKDKKKIQKSPQGGIELIRNIRKGLKITRYKVAKDLNWHYNSCKNMEETAHDCFTKPMVKFLLYAGKTPEEIGKILVDYAKTENK